MRSFETVRQGIRLYNGTWVVQGLVREWAWVRLWLPVAGKAPQTFTCRWLAVETRTSETIKVKKRKPNHPDSKHRDPTWLDTQRNWTEKILQSTGSCRASSEPRFVNGANFKESRSVAGFGRSLQVGIWRQSGKEEQLSEEFEALDLLVQAGAYVDDFAFFKVLKRCIAQKDLVLGSRVHGLVLQSGYRENAFLANHIICMYASHGRLEEATEVFGEVASPNHHVWASIILAHARNGRPKEAITLYQQMQESTVKPNNHIFAAALKACANAKDLSCGRQVHADILGTGSKPDLVLCNCLVDMYAKCGSLEDAHKMFDTLPIRDVVTWNSMIKGYAQHGRGLEALKLYSRMRQEGKPSPNHITFLCLLQACSSAGDLISGKRIHIQIKERGLEFDAAVGNCLVNMYATCGSLEDARRVFDNLPVRDVVTWNAMIKAYVDHGLPHEAVSLYGSMKHEGMTSGDAFTFLSLLQACGTVAGLEQGKEIHLEVSRLGLEASNLSVANALIAMYASCGSLGEARRVFDNLSIRDVVTWTAMIAGYSQNGFGQEALGLYARMQQEGITAADAIAVICVLQACSSLQDLDKGKEIHAEILCNESLTNDLFVGNALIDMYSKCGSLDDARRVFDNMPTRDVVTWTAIMAAYAQNGLGQEALGLYASMQEEGITTANHVTFMCLLQACAGAGALHEGKLLHAKIEERGLEEDVVLGTCLVDMYSKCGSLEDARKVFDNLPTRYLVTWNSMLRGYAQRGLAQEALDLYGIMQQEGITLADSVTFVCLLQACGNVAELEKGKKIHGEIMKMSLDMSDSFVANALINMYSKCGSLLDARRVFDNLPGKDLVTWTAMIAGYAQHGDGQEALDIHANMQQEGFSAADAATFVCLLQACVSIRALDQGRQLHAQIVEKGLEHSGLVGNSLVNMYAKCGSLEEARRVFDNLPSRNVVTWNAMITGYIQHGCSAEAFALFEMMKQEDKAPADAVTYVCLLQACGKVAGLEKGREIHAEVSRVGLDTSDLFVANSLIDMYGKCGSVLDAKQVFDVLRSRDTVTWNAMIAACARQGESELVFDLFDRMRQEGIQPNGVTFLSAISVCSHVGLVGQGQKYFQSMRRDHSITPTIEHYNCMVDLFARAGELGTAMEMVKTMPFQPPAEVWTSLLGACQKWGSVEVGRQAFECAVNSGKDEAAAYILMSNICEAAQLWEEATEIRAMRVEARASKEPGQSWWTDTNGIVHRFSAGDREQPVREHAHAHLAYLSSKMTDEWYLPHLNSKLS